MPVSPAAQEAVAGGLQIEQPGQCSKSESSKGLRRQLEEEALDSVDWKQEAN